MIVKATAPVVTPPAAPVGVRRRGRWIDDWRPDDEGFWEGGGKQVARRNLVISIFAEHIGFCIWVIWTIVVINLSNIGITMSLSEQFLLTLVPNLIGSVLRVPYTFAIPKFGGRAWTTTTVTLLLVPALLLALVVPSHWLAEQSHSAQFWILLGCAATAGVGGGNFASSMANISFFYPERRKGFALGLNAAGGNLGVAVCQLLIPLVIIIGVPSAAVKLPRHQIHLAYAGYVWLPLIAAAGLAAWWWMNSLTEARTDTEPYVAALRTLHTWVISLLYIGTFGSFIGFSFSMPLVIKNTFPTFLAHHPFIATYLAGLGFLGAAVGSLSRPIGGWLADRAGGPEVTLAAFAIMAVATAAAIAGVEGHSFSTFLVSYLFVFLLAGIGNGSTYKMIPAMFAAQGRAEAYSSGRPAAEAAVEYKRRAAAAIGIAGAIGAFGGVLVQVVLRQSSLHVTALLKSAKTPAAKAAVAASHSAWSVPALWVFLVAYLVLAAVTWSVYLRRRQDVDVPEPAERATA